MAWEGNGVSREHAIGGARGTTTSVHEPEPMDDFLVVAFGVGQLRSEGLTTRIRPARAPAWAGA